MLLVSTSLKPSSCNVVVVVVVVVIVNVENKPSKCNIINPVCVLTIRDTGNLTWSFTRIIRLLVSFSTINDNKEILCFRSSSRVFIMYVYLLLL